MQNKNAKKAGLAAPLVNSERHLLINNDNSDEMALYFEGSTYLHGLISDGLAASGINILIDAAFAVAGYGSLSAMIKGLGKAAVKKYLKEEVVDSLKAKLASWGARYTAAVLGGILGKVVDAVVNPGKSIAKWIDSMDHYPNNGYWEFTG